MLIGITHDLNRQPVIREPRVLRVGIGVPKGPSCYVYTHGGRWIVRYGSMVDGKFTLVTAKGADGKNGFATRAEAERWYTDNKKNFAAAKYPMKIPFFTFTRRVLVGEGQNAVERFEPDFAAIDAHGDTPREIDIVFSGDNPLFGQYQAWGAAELKCHGDGVGALRVIALGNETMAGWSEAKAAGEKMFPVGECATSGLCPYYKDGGHNKLVCKPMTTLAFQLANNIRLGATAYFTTTSIRSAVNLFSSLETIRGIAQRAGSGIANTPLKLVMAPYKTNHNGISATQWGVSLELRAEDTRRLRELLSEAAWKVTPQQPRLIEAADISEFVEAPAIVEEFFPEVDEEEQGPDASTAQTATDSKTDDLAARLKQEAAASEERRKAESAPATDPSKEEIPVDDRDQRARASVEGFRKVLGDAEFVAVLHSVTGSESVHSVSFANYDAVFKAMSAAKSKAAPGEPGEKRNLF